MPRQYTPMPLPHKPRGRKQENISDDLKGKVCQMKAERYTLADIAKETGLSLFIVRRVLKESKDEVSIPEQEASIAAEVSVN